MLNTMKTATEYYLSMVFLVLPLIMTNSYYNITETKSVTFHIVSYVYLLIAAIFYAVRLCTAKNKMKDKEVQKTKRHKLCLLDICMLSFAFFVLVSAVFSEFSESAWLGISARYQGALTIVVYVLLYFVISRNFCNCDALLRFAAVAFIAVCLLAVGNNFNIDIFGVYSELSAQNKASYISTIGNINFYSSYICLLLPLVVCGFCNAKEKYGKIVYTIALVVGAWGMLLTASESFMIGFFVAAAIIPLFLYNNQEILKKYLQSLIIIAISCQFLRIVYWIVEKLHGKVNVQLSGLLKLWLHPLVWTILLVLCVGGLLLIKANKSFLVIKKVHIAVLICGAAVVLLSFFIVNVFLYDKDVALLGKLFKITPEWGNYRGEIWQQCIRLYKEFNVFDKLFGIGPESLQNITQSSEIFGGRVMDQAHNEYLHLLLTTGVFGLLSYLSVIFATCYTVAKKLKDEPVAVGVFAGLAAYWVQATVNIAQPFSTPIMFLYIAMLGGLLVGEDKPLTKAKSRRGKRRKKHG